MIGHPASGGPYRVEAGAGRGLWWRRALRIGLTGRLILLVTIAVLPALVIQAVNEYYLRLARADDIRKQVVQTTDQFGEEIGELREGARQLLLTLAQLDTVKLRQSESCSLLFAKLKAQYSNYAVLGAADSQGRVFCTSGDDSGEVVADRAFFRRAMAHDGLAVGNYWADPTTGKKMIHFAARFEDNADRISGVVFAGLDLDWLSGHLKQRGLSPTASILIADKRATSSLGCRIRGNWSARICGKPMKGSWMATRPAGKRRKASTGSPEFLGTCRRLCLRRTSF